MPITWVVRNLRQDYRAEFNPVLTDLTRLPQPWINNNQSHLFKPQTYYVAVFKTCNFELLHKSYIQMGEKTRYAEHPIK